MADCKLARSGAPTFAHFFSHPYTLRRLEAVQAAPLILGFAKDLDANGYAKATIRNHIRAASHLSSWCEVNRIELRQLDHGVLARFDAHLPKCRCLINKRGDRRNTRIGIRVYLRHLQRLGEVPIDTPPVRAKHAILSTFLDWIRRERGLAETTIASYELHVSAAIAELGDNPRLYTASQLRAFVLRQTRSPHPYRAQKVVSALRGFLRYLIVHKQCPAQLMGAVPIAARWRRASIPRYLRPDAVERIINACDVSSRSGLCDRAMLLLLARLGLRAGEVAGLRLRDLDWQRGRIRVWGKGRRECHLPLPQDAGDAILAYLRSGRPHVNDDHVFLRHQPPIGPYTRSQAISYRVRVAMRRAGVEFQGRGAAHLLRHSLASDLLRQGATLDSIGALLRHRSRETTALYSNVDVGLLRQVAQPWPSEEGLNALDRR